MGRRSKRKKLLLRQHRLLGIELDPQEARRVGLGHIIDEQERVKAEAEAKRIAEEKAAKAAEEKARKEAEAKAEADKKRKAEAAKKKKAAAAKRKTTKAKKDSED